MKFFSTVGLELTWLYYKRSRAERDWIGGYSDLIRAAMTEKKFRFHEVCTDEGALEIATAPFSSMNQIRSYYNRLLTFLSHYPLVSHRDDTVSGGGHIHCAIPKRITRNPDHLLCFLSNVFRDLTNRPYLNWIFNEWANKESAENFVWMRRTIRGRSDLFSTLPDDAALMKVIFSDKPAVGLDIDEKGIYRIFSGTKGYAARVDYNDEKKPPTLELRFFDAKKCFRDIELHVDFVNAYLRYLDRKTLSGKIVKSEVKTGHEIAALAYKDRGIKQFKTLMEDLELNYADYRDFVEANYRKRKEAGFLR